jgi:hypothetical protein
MNNALYDAVAFGMRYWFLVLIALMLFGLIAVSVGEYRSKKSVMGEVVQYIGYLEIVDGVPDAEGLRVGLMKDNMIGSGSKADILIEDASVSKSHALIHLKDDRLILSPVGKGVTKINGRKATRTHGVFSGDLLTFGNVSAYVYLKESDEDDN